MAADEFAISLDDEEVKHEDVQMADAAPLLNTAQGNGKAVADPVASQQTVAQLSDTAVQHQQLQPSPSHPQSAAAASSAPAAARQPIPYPQQQQQKLQSQQQANHRGQNPNSSQHLNPMRPRMQIPEGKILILFDLNGVLTDHTPARQEGKYIVRDHIVRPQIEELLRLLPHFALGIFSSATKRTVNTAMGVIHRKLREAAAAKGVEGLLLPHINTIFSVVCDRSCCQPDPHWRSRPDGKEWDTIKPLARQGFDVRRTILVDNDHYKSASGEEDSMFLMPHWEQEPVSDRDLPILVELLLQRLKSEMGDVRPHLEPMRQVLLKVRQQQLPQQQQQQQQQFDLAADWWAQGQQQQQQQGVEQSAAVVDGLLSPQQQQQQEDAVGNGIQHVDQPATAADKQKAAFEQGKLLARAKEAAYRGYKMSHLSAAPENVQQLVAVLTKYSAATSSSSGSSSSPGVVHVSSLLAAGAAADGSSSAALAAAAVEMYKQHVSNVLLAAVWAAGFSAPTGFTLQQLLDAMIYKGLPTRHADRVMDILIRRGEVVIPQVPQQQQQQGQQQQQWWPWPVDPKFWPAGGLSPHQQQQQQYAWSSSILAPVANMKKLRSMKKHATVIRELLKQGPTAVAAVLEGYGTKPLCPGDEGYYDNSNGQNPADGEQQQQGLAAAEQWPRGNLVMKHNPRLHEWRTVLFIAARDLLASRGVMSDQIMQFVQGFRPDIAQQLLGDLPQQQQQHKQQQLARSLDDLAVQQQQQQQLPSSPSAATAEDTGCSSNSCVLQSLLSGASGLISERWNPSAATDQWQQQEDEPTVAQHQQLRDAAAAALIRYHCNIVPDAAAVAQSLEVLSIAAAAAAAAAASGEQQQQQPEFQALVDQLQHLLIQPAASVLPDVPNSNIDAASQLALLLPLLNAPSEAKPWFEHELLLLQNKQQKQDRKRKRGDTEGLQQQQKAGPQPVAGVEQGSPAAAAAAEDGSSALLSLLPAQDHHQQQLQQQQQVEEGDMDADGTEERSIKQQRVEQQQQQQQGEEEAAGQQPGLASEFWLEQQQQLGDAASPAAAPADIDSSQDIDGAAVAAAVAAAAAEAEDDNDEEMQDSDHDSDAAADDHDGSSSSSDEDEDHADPAGDHDQTDHSSDDSDDHDGDQGDGGSSSDGSSSSGDEDDDDPAGADDDSSGSDDSDQGLGDQPDQDQGLDEDDESSGSDQGLAGQDEDEMGFDKALSCAEAALGELYDADEGLDDAEAALNDLYAADELAAAQDEDEEAGWVTDDEYNDDYDGFDDDAHDDQLQLGISGVEGSADRDAAVPAAAAAAARVQGKRQQLPGGRPLHDELAAAVAAAAGSKQQQAGSSSSKSALHRELLIFSAAAAPSAVERLVLKCALEQLQSVAKEIWPTAEAVLFGSQATGLALPGSDLDVVLLGTPCPKTKSAAEGYRPRDRLAVKKLLFQLRRALCRKGHARESTLHVIDARVPLCKGPMRFTIPRSALEPAAAQDLSAGAAASCAVLAAVAYDAIPRSISGRRSDCFEVELPVDLSLGVANGAAAVSFMTRQVLALPPLRPLVLIIKALLKEAGLNEVFTGGLSSYSLVNMVVAHLQAEGMTAARMSHTAAAAGSSSSSSGLDVPVVSQERVQQHLAQLAAAAAAGGIQDHSAAGSSTQQQQQQQQWDLGCLLQGFFMRFGEIFSYQQEAVSVRAGGIITKRPQWIKPAPADILLSVEDPQQFGRDIASASRAIKEVREVFSWASDSIKRMMQYFEGTAEGQQQLAAAAGAAQLPCKDTAAAAASSSGSNCSSKPPDLDLSGMTEEQKWAAVQSAGQSQSVPETVLQQHQQQQQSQQQQQQYQAGYVMLSNMIDVYGALGRGAAADTRRQQLVSAAAAARKAKVQQQKQQQVQHMHQHGVRVAGAKGSLKIPALDHAMEQSAAAAAAAAASAAAAAAAAADDADTQRLLNLFGQVLTAIAAAECAFEKSDFKAAFLKIQAAQVSFVDTAQPAAAEVAAAAAGGVFELLRLFEIQDVARRIIYTCKRLMKVADVKLGSCKARYAKSGGAAAAAGSSDAAAAAAAEAPASGRGARRACREKADTAAAAKTFARHHPGAAAAAAALEAAESEVQQLNAVILAVDNSVKSVNTRADQVLLDRKKSVPGNRAHKKSSRQFIIGSTDKIKAQRLVGNALVAAARNAGILDIRVVRAAVKCERKVVRQAANKTQRLVAVGGVAAAAAAAAGNMAKRSGKNKSQQQQQQQQQQQGDGGLAAAKQYIQEAGLNVSVPKSNTKAGQKLRAATGISKAALARLWKEQQQQQRSGLKAQKQIGKKAANKQHRKMMKQQQQQEGANGVSPVSKRKQRSPYAPQQQQQQQFGSHKGSKRQRGGSGGGGGGRGWGHE